MKLYNTKRRLAIHPGDSRNSHMKDLAWWSRSDYGPQDFLLFFKGGKHLKVSFNQNSPHYTKNPPRIDRDKIFGVATKNRIDGTWKFVAYVYNHEHKLSSVMTDAHVTARKSLKAGILKMREHYVRTNKLLSSSAEEKLEAALKSHDWWHMMSDDPKVWRRGEQSLAKIRDLYSQVDPQTGKGIWLKYAPKNVTPPV